jgi:hypothetical protein
MIRVPVKSGPGSGLYRIARTTSALDLNLQDFSRREKIRGCVSSPPRRRSERSSLLEGRRASGCNLDGMEVVASLHCSEPSHPRSRRGLAGGSRGRQLAAPGGAFNLYSPGGGGIGWRRPAASLAVACGGVGIWISLTRRSGVGQWKLS